MKPKITEDIWDDPDFIELPDNQKLGFFWLLTKADMLGYIEVTPRKLRRDFDETDGVIEGLAKGLPRALVKVGRGYWLKNFIGHQYGRGPTLIRNNIAKSVARRLSESEGEFVKEVLKGYPELLEVKDNNGSQIIDKAPLEGKGLPSPDQALTKGKGTGTGTGTGEKGGVGENKPAEKKPPPENPDPEARRPADALLDFPCQKRGEVWWLTKEKCEQWAMSYPRVNILATARQARQWCIDNPAKRKTPKGMANFLGGWIMRNTNRGQAIILRDGERQEWEGSTGQPRQAADEPPKNWHRALEEFFEKEEMVGPLKRLRAGTFYTRWSDVNEDHRDEVRAIAELNDEGGAA